MILLGAIFMRLLNTLTVFPFLFCPFEQDRGVNKRVEEEVGACEYVPGTITPPIATQVVATAWHESRSQTARMAEPGLS